MSPRCLEDLLPELLTEVAHYRCHTADLHVGPRRALCLTSRLLRSVATPALWVYTTIHRRTLRWNRESIEPSWKEQRRDQLHGFWRMSGIEWLVIASPGHTLLKEARQ